MPHQTEPSVNNAMGTLLQVMLPRSDVRSENTQAIYGHPSLRPDILITAPGRAPVVIEAEYMPAASVEVEAKDRLGHKTTADHRVIEAAIALRYPDEVGEAQDLSAALSDARLSYCVFTENGGATRFPETGWLDGSVEDLADMVRLVSVPQHAVDRATAFLQEGIDGAAKILDELDQIRPGITEAIAKLLGMANVLQTRRMACAIIANALVFHDQIAGMHAKIKSLALACGDGVDNPQGEVLAAWTAILNINYWPIFAIAKDILGHFDSADAARILHRLRDTAQAVNATGVENAHDLTGRIFQRLIADRKYLATFYTLPASAALLARLAVAKLEGVDWSNAEAIGKLRIGDFACGTGALLSAVYEQIAARHERTGGDGSKLHKVMMEEVLYGCDVMPSAIHITGSTLSGVEPAVGFTNSRLYAMPYGRQKDSGVGGVMIGSLELLQSSRVQTLFNTSDPALRTGSAGEETAALVSTEIPDIGFDLVIMNPPFTRATNHEGAHADITNPAFAAFDATDEDQSAMGKRATKLAKNTCSHGNAGIASTFAALAHKKVRLGGVLALVLPLSTASGLSWEDLREMIARDYTDVTILSIAENDREMSFSSDTGMAECLVIARRLRVDEKPNDTYRFISLSRRPQGFAYARALGAGCAHDSSPVRKIENGPYGGTPIMIGGELAGYMITTPRALVWRAVRVSDYSVAQTAYALTQSELWPPACAAPVELKTAILAEVGALGLVDRDINGKPPKPGKPPRGPFDKVDPSPTATYPSLWNHTAKNETRMVCDPDSQLQVRQGMEEKASDVWATASRTHLNREYTFGSQPLAVAYTEKESIGGTAWPNVIFPSRGFDYAFTVWGNSTLGLLSYWWHSSRQQSSKARMTIRSAESLPVLDLRCLTDEQLLMAETIFDEFRDKDLMPAYLSDADPNRALLDRRVICDLLGFGEEIYVAVRRLSAKWCAEPSVHGGKKGPVGADLVV